MAAETLAQLEAQLVEVNAALTKTRKAISTSQGGKSVTRDYNNLLREKQMLVKQINRRSGLNPMVASADMTGGE